MGPTPLTLLEQICRDDDPTAWDRFSRLYRDLLIQWGRRAGLSLADAEDVCQEVMLKCHQSLRERNMSGSFRGWLSTVLRNAIIDFRRRPANRLLPQTVSLVEVADTVQELDEATEYRRHLLQRGLDIVRGDFDESTWTAFYRTAIDNIPVSTVSQDLGIKAGAVYSARFRVLQRLRQVLDGLFE